MMAAEGGRSHGGRHHPASAPRGCAVGKPMGVETGLARYRHPLPTRTAADALQLNSLKPRLLSDPRLHVQNGIGAGSVAGEDPRSGAELAERLFGSALRFRLALSSAGFRPTRAARLGRGRCRRPRPLCRRRKSRRQTRPSPAKIRCRSSPRSHPNPRRPRTRRRSCPSSSSSRASFRLADRDGQCLRRAAPDNSRLPP